MELLEIIDIRYKLDQAYLNYCEALDRKDFERLRLVFTPDCTRFYLKEDGTHEIRDYDENNEAGRGLDILIRRIERDLGPQTGIVTHHNVMNHQYDIRSATDASVKCHYYAVHQHPGEPIFTAWGEYDDDFALTDAGWRIKTRRYSTWLTEGPNIVLGGKAPLKA